MALLPKVKFKSVVNFPATAEGRTGIEVSKENGKFFLDLDYSRFGEISSIPTSPTSFILTYDTALGSYVMVPSHLLGGGVSGIADAPVDGTTYARNSGAWLNIDARFVTSYNGMSGAVAAFATDKRYFVSTSGNDANNGLSPESAKRTIQAALTAASGGGAVEVGAGAYVLTSALLMTPGVRLMLAPGATVTQANGANLAPIVDFSTNAAHGAAIVGGTIDGNRANSNETLGTVAAIGLANDVTIERVSFVNAPGSAVTISSGLRPRVVNNAFTNIGMYGIFVNTGTANYTTHGRFIGNNFNAPFGYHPMGVVNSNHNVISQNKVIASQIGGVAAPMRVNISGTTVTWVSGPDFSLVTPGMFLVINGGDERFITAKASTTSLTLSNTPGSFSNILAVIGTGDLFGIDSSSDNLISDNFLSGGATAGIIISNASGGADARRNKVRGNRLFYQGECSLCASRSVGIYEVGETEFDGNLVYNAAQTGSVAGPSGAFRAGITIAGPAVNTLIDNNTVLDDQVTKTCDYWLGLSGVNAGQVIVGTNVSNGPTNGQAVLAGLGTVTLSAGWGSGAVVNSVVSYGSSFAVTLTAGTGPGVNPTVTVPTVATGANPVGSAKAFANATGGAVNVIGDQAMGLASKVFTFIGTPTASAAYTIYVSGN